MIGILFALVPMICWGIADFTSKICVDNASKWKVLFLGNLAGFSFLFLTGVFIGGIMEITITGILFLVFLGILNFIGMGALYKSLEKNGVSIISPMVNSWALITLVLGVLVYGETPGILQIIGAVLIIGGIISTTQSEKPWKFDRTLAYAGVSMSFGDFFSLFSKYPWPG